MSMFVPMKHYWKKIEGWCAFSHLYMEVVAKAPKDRPSTFVEVGSWLGRSAAFMGVEIYNARKPITLTCIDPWTDGGPDLRDTKYYKDLKHSPFDLFTNAVQPVKQFIRPLRMTSLEAVKHFSDQSIDFLMLDGDHSYEMVKQEIQAYLPKMRAGGIISGDDYTWPGVKQAVDEAFPGVAEISIINKNKDWRKDASYWKVQL